MKRDAEVAPARPPSGADLPAGSLLGCVSAARRPVADAPAKSSQPVAVIIVAWNSARVIASCLRAVLTENPAEVIVVDNASTDRTARVVSDFAAVRCIGVAANSGFAAGCNLGVACSKAPYVLFLNDDAEVRPGYLSTLVKALEGAPAAASATGKLVVESTGLRRIDSAGIELGAHALRPLDRGHGALDQGQYDDDAEIFGPSGAAALFRRAALDSLPDEPFDSALFAYYEDVDLAWRLRRRGWSHLYRPAAVAHHGRRGPGGKPAVIKARAFVNRYTVWRKNEAWWRFALYAPIAVPWELVRLGRLARRDLAAVREIGKQLVGWGAL